MTPAAALAAVLSARNASASIPPLLCDSTTRAAVQIAARNSAVGVPPTATALAQEVLRTMLWQKLKIASTTLAAFAMIAAGAVHLTRSPARGDDPEMRRPPAANVAPSSTRPNDRVQSRMSIVGRVVDPAGQPIRDARVTALADRERQVGDRDGRHRNIPVSAAATDAQGRFTLEFPAMAAARLQHLSLVAGAPGRGLEIVELKTDTQRQETTIALRPETPAEGRIVDVQGQPVVGVTVRATRLQADGHEIRTSDAGRAPTAWPSPATTDANGRFQMRGLKANAPVTFEVNDPRFARQVFKFPDGKPAEGKLQPGTMVILQPARAIDFHVVHGDDGTPVAGARVDLQPAPRMGSISAEEDARGQTDGQGRVRIVGWPADSYRIRVYPPEGDSYLPAIDEINWPKGAVRQTVELKLKRGAVVRGRVVEGSDNTPVAGAWATYNQTYRGNRRYIDLPPVEAVSGQDGTFAMVVPQGPGHILVQGPTADYLHVETSSSAMGTGERPSFHKYPDAHVALDIPEGEATRNLEVRLRRGVTVTGRVVGPDGKPVASAFVFGRSYVPYRENIFPLVGFNGSPPTIEVKDGRFEIPGCDPERPSTFYFLDTKDRLGATVELSGRPASGEPVTVRLARTATAQILMVGPDGKPIADHDYGDWPTDLTLVITPGPDFGELNANFDLTPADHAYHVNLDPSGYRGGRSGPDGRATLINLIPGAHYRFHGREFTPEPGQTVDLGEARIERPSN